MSCSMLLILRELIRIMAVSKLVFFSPLLSSLLPSFSQLILIPSLRCDRDYARRNEA